jgi:hypothetical protein
MVPFPTVALGVLNDARARQQRRRWRITATVGTATVAVVLGLVGVGGSTSPETARPPHAAISVVSCITAPSTSTTGAPSSALPALLAVLRRPATADDRLPPQLHADLLGGGLDVFAGYVRLARVVADRSYYVIPARIACGVKPSDDVLLACVQRSGERIIDAGLGGDATATGVTGGGAFLVGGSCLHTKQATLIAGIVPDGVTSVTLRYPSMTIEAAVVNNVVAASVPHPGGPLWHPLLVTWRAADGHVIMTFSTL